LAKRKKKKRNTKKKQNVLKVELLGLLLIFLAILGSGAGAISDGAIPSGLEYIFRFFLGIWYFIASISLFVIGLWLLVKRKLPDFSNRKIIGFLILFAGLLLFTHIQTFERLYISPENISIIRASWDNFWLYVNGTGNFTQTGGGMIGAILFIFCYFLFSMAGAKIVAVFSMLVGILFITNLSLTDFIAKLNKRLSALAHQLKTRWQNRQQEKKKEKESQQVPVQETDDKDSNETVTHDFPDVSIAVPEQQEQNQETEIQKAESPAGERPSDENINGEPLPMTEEENYAYILPSADLLRGSSNNAQKYDKSQIQATVRKLEKTFDSFNVNAKISKVHVGPSVTKYEVYPGTGVKVSKIVNLHDDIALALAAKDIRIEAPIPGKSAVGIEVPNAEISMVSLKEVLEPTWDKLNSKLLVALGRNIAGDTITTELNKMPHLLIAGATGSGKSVCVNGIITSILMRTKPHEVKLMMIDPKKVELNVYNGIPHLLAPVVTDPKKAAKALKKVVSEMERRYDLFADTGTRNIEGYNEYIRKYNQTAEEKQPNLPYIVVLVDELADLMMVASSDVEDAITRLAQMARAAGIHLIIATQRPSVDVITGIIKANIPSRIAFSVSSSTDSRTILDSGGAEKLLGSGDMLFLPVGASKPTRVQGAFISDEEVESVVDFCVEQQKATYQEEMIPDETDDTMEEVDDELYDDAVHLVIDMQSASVSMLQRRFRIGYNRAARLIDAMELRGIIGPYEGSKPRSVLIDKSDEEQKMS